MTSVAPTAIKNESNLKGATNVGHGQSVSVNNGPKEATAGRKFGEAIAGVGSKAVEMGKDAAQKGVNVLADQAISGVEHNARHLVRGAVLNQMASLYSMMNVFLPFNVGKNIFSLIVSNFFFPYYKQINPNTKITPAEIIDSLERGHTDSIENEVFDAFDKFIVNNLTKEERVKYENGDKKVVIMAFKNLAQSQISTAREPGGIPKICRGIANFIPLINKLPDVAKPWVGGAIGVLVAYKLAKFAWRMVKWGVMMFAGFTGLKFLANRFGGGGAHPGLGSMPAMHGEESPAEAGGGFMNKLMQGASKVAEMASQAQGGGHGAPGGGIGQALAALAGGGAH